MGVLGPNGAGKTTLLKILIGREKPDEGEVRHGHKVQIGYYDQGLEALPPTTSVVRAVWPDDEPGWVEQDTRDLLGRFGLSGDLAHQTVGKLSGGERGKAALARLAATGANVLVMDEPTNHLDIWSCEALERSILEFEGTVLVVSHDRYFLNQVADRIVHVSDGRARVIEGNYETYLRLMQQEEQRNAEAKVSASGAAATSGSSSGSGRAKRARTGASGSESIRIGSRRKWSVRSASRKRSWWSLRRRWPTARPTETRKRRVELRPVMRI